MPLAARLDDFNQVLANPESDLYVEARDAVRNAGSLSNALDQAATSMEALSDYPEVAEGVTVLGRLDDAQNRAAFNALRNAFDRGLAIELAWKKLPAGQAVTVHHAEVTDDNGTRLVVTVSSPDGRTMT